jgi:hypothetical protein
MKMNRPISVRKAPWGFMYDVYFRPNVTRPNDDMLLSLIVHECELSAIVVPYATDLTIKPSGIRVAIDTGKKAGGEVLFPENEPPDKDVHGWICYACEIANKFNACLHLCCETAVAVEEAAKVAEPLLPDHEYTTAKRFHRLWDPMDKHPNQSFITSRLN